MWCQTFFVVFCHFSGLKWKMFTNTVNDLNVHILDDFSIKILKIDVAVTILDIFTVKWSLWSHYSTSTILSTTRWSHIRWWNEIGRIQDSCWFHDFFYFHNKFLNIFENNFGKLLEKYFSWKMASWSLLSSMSSSKPWIRYILWLFDRCWRLLQKGFISKYSSLHGINQ